MVKKATAGVQNEALGVEHKKDIAKAFALFDQDGSGKIDNKALLVCLQALGQSPTTQELNQIVTNYGDEDGNLDYNAFQSILNANINKADSHEQMTQAFKFFANPSTNTIEVNDLKAVADELGDSISVEEIQQMISIASSAGDGGVTLDDFCKIVGQRKC